MKDHRILLQTHMEMLCEIIGARPTGSAKNKAAADYIFGVFQNCGLQIRKQEFECIDWVNYGAKLIVNGCDVPVEPSRYSLSCDVEGEFVCIDTLDALQKETLSDKIAVLYGDLCKESLMPKNFDFWNPDEHKKIIALLEEKNPKAIITVNQNKEYIIQDGDFNIPCSMVSDKSLNVFLGSTNKKAKLTIITERIPTKAHNVIAACGTSKHKVCFSAHFDTNPMTPGALDNASGVSVLLALAESLSGKEYPFTVEIVLLNGEDYYSTPGEMEYMNELTVEHDMAINVDGIGLKDSATSVSFYEFPKDLEYLFMECVNNTNGMERIEPWLMGDHMIFATWGTPTIAMTASNIFSLLNTIIHSPDDDMQNIDIDVLDNAVQFLLDCLKICRYAPLE